MSDTSQKITAVMKEKHISVRRLSEMTGITKSSVSNYMNGLRAIPLDKLQLIAVALGVSAKWLIGWSEDREENQNEKKPTAKSELEIESEEFVQLFTSLDPENRKRILDLMRALASSQA